MDLTENEVSKYTEMWSHKEYRIDSPGEKIFHQAVHFMTPESTVYDFGCGTGRATKMFIEEGFQATGIDFVDNALEVDVPFIRANLWDRNSIPAPMDFGYCCDVMEHIPTKKVEAVLTNICENVNEGCFFQIALFPDSMGDLIGHRLHLTVESSKWWIDLLSQFFSSYEIIQDDFYLSGFFRK